MNAFKFARALWRKMAADPMAAINAKRVADMKAMAGKVRTASGTPGQMGNGMNGTHSWSGRVMPGGNVQGAQYSHAPVPGAPTLAPASQSSQPLQKAPAMQSAQANAFSKRQAPQPPQQKQLTWDDEAAWDQDVDSTKVMHTPGSAAAAKQLGGQFNAMNASAGGAGRAGMSNTPAPRPASMSMLSSTPMQPKVTTTPVNNAALRKQLQQAQQQSAPLTKQPATINNAATKSFPFSTGMGPASASAAATRPTTPQPPPRPGAGGGAPMAALDPNNLPANVIKTDNGRLFDTAAKKFLDGQPGGFAR